MNYLDIAKADLMVDEGFAPNAYKDSRGYWTIGYGRLIDKEAGGGVTTEEGAYLLANDLRRADADAKVLFQGFETLSETRKAVLVELAFNMGRNHLASFVRFRNAVAIGDWEVAAVELLNSRWAVQVGRRANRLAEKVRRG